MTRITEARARVALVGAGTMGSMHARVIATSDRAELACVVEPNAEAARGITDRWDVPVLSSVDELPAVDAVVVAAPTEFHPAIGTHVLERGLPLLMEKPLADDLGDAEQLVKLSAQYDVPLMCGLLERYNPALMTALMIAEAPRYVTTTRHSPYVSRIRTGVTSDLLVHDVDVVLRLAGAMPTTVRAAFGYLHPESAAGSEDVAEATLSFADGMVAAVSASRLGQRKVRIASIAELDRLIEADLVRNTVTIYRHVLHEADSDWRSYRQQTLIEIPALVSGREPLVAQFDRFLDLVAGTADAEQERATILAPHEVLHRIRGDAKP